MKLSQDIKSSLDIDVIYGLQGDIVKVISYRGSVAIVEGVSGKRFTVKIELLVESAEPKEEVKIIDPKKVKKIINAKSKPVQPSGNELF